jgi:glycine cleavage system H protein
MVALFVVVAILLFLTVDHVVQRLAIRAEAKVPAPVRVPHLAPAADVFVGPGHAWARLESAGTLRVGADGLAATLLGRIEAIEVAAPGTALRRGEPLATFTAGGRRVVLPAPCDATVEARNASLEPSRVAADPFGHGWLARLKPRSLGAALREMRIGEEAATWLREERNRLRDALVSATNSPAAVGATMADGGVPFVAADGGELAPGAGQSLPPETFARIAGEFFSIPAIDAERR